MFDNSISVICGTILLLAVVGGMFALTWHGSITGAEMFGIIVSIVSLAGGAFAHHAGVVAAGNVVNGAATTAATNDITTPTP